MVVERAVQRMRLQAPWGRAVMLAAAVALVSCTHHLSAEPLGATTPRGAGCSVDAPEPPAEVSVLRAIYGTLPGGRINIPGALPPPPPGPPMTEQEAIAAARLVPREHGPGAAPASAPVRAMMVAYVQLSRFGRGPGAPDIAPNRCIWVVTVHAPNYGGSGPVGPPPPGSPTTRAPAPRPPYPVYTAYFDVATGWHMGTGFGDDAFNPKDVSPTTAPPSPPGTLILPACVYQHNCGTTTTTSPQTATTRR